MIAGDRNPVGDRRRRPTTPWRERPASAGGAPSTAGDQPTLQLDLVVDGELAPPVAEPASASRRNDSDGKPAGATPVAGSGRASARPSDGEVPLVLTAAQVEVALQIGRTRTYELLRSGQIPTVRVGRLIRVSRVALEQWIAEHGTAGDGEGAGGSRAS